MQTLEDGTESYFSAANYNLEGSQLATVSIRASLEKFLQEKFKEPSKQAINPDNNHHHTNGVFFLLYPSLGFFSVESHGHYVSSFTI
jgi:post-segregation antitoxin (ccd killing protein)